MTVTVAQPVEVELDPDTLLTEGRFALVPAALVKREALVIMGASIYRVTSIHHTHHSVTLNLRRGAQRFSISLTPTEDVVLAMPHTTTQEETAA